MFAALGPIAHTTEDIMPTKNKANRSSRKERRIERLEARQTLLDQQHQRQVERMRTIYGRRAQ